MRYKERRDRFPLAPAFFLVFAGACSSNPDSQAVSEISDSAGVRIVENAGPLWEEGDGWSVDPEAVLSIGMFSGPEEYQFVEVSAGARAAGGEIVLADRGSKSVAVYDGSGAFVRELGGPGSGPGEFQDPGQVMISSGNSVLVWDQQAFRVTRFQLSGQFEGVETLDLARISKAVAPPLFPGNAVLLESGDYLVRLVEKAIRKGPPNTSEPFRDRSGALRVSRDLSIIDTLAFFLGAEQLTVEAPFGPYPVPLPLGRDTWIAHGGNPPRVCIGDQVGMGIRCIHTEGEATNIRWNVPPPPVAKEEMERWREEISRLFGPKLSEREVQAMLDQVPPPQTRPPHGELLLDKSGNLWAKHGPSEEGGGAFYDYLVFEEGGRLLGTVTLPDVEVLEIGEDHVLGVYRDELEVEFVRLYDLRKAPTPQEGP